MLVRLVRSLDSVYDTLEFQEQNNLDVINTEGNLATKETKETLNLKNENEILKEDKRLLIEGSRKFLEENKLLKDEVERLKCLQKEVRDNSNKMHVKQQKIHRENVELKKSLEGCNAINSEEVDQMKTAINDLLEKDNHKDEILASQDLQQ
ncbi:rho-associated protein kinase 2-like [Mytilus trossulus]|uniref:rho-associated protein kinase 2-like n=1 Tax=Mytilus trossulus TaxID=6551 RepID=UPI0030066155